MMKAVLDWYDIGQDAEKYNPRDLDWHGFSVAPGAHLSFGYGLMDFGKLQGVVELGSNWCTDGERHFISVGLRIGIVPLIERFSG